MPMLTIYLNVPCLEFRIENSPMNWVNSRPNNYPLFTELGQFNTSECDSVKEAIRPILEALEILGEVPMKYLKETPPSFSLFFFVHC